MKLKGIISMAVSLIAIGCTHAQEFLFDSIHTAPTTNYQTDDVAGMVMDANGNTYVLQNLYDYYTGSNSIAGMTGGLYTDEHAMTVVDKIEPNGAKSTIAWIEITTNYSAVTGTGIAIGSDGNLYVSGHFYGDISFPRGPAGPPLTSSSVVGGTDYGRQMFICKINPAGNVIDRFTDGGTGDEVATCISVSGSNIFVGGYYGVYDNSGTQTTDFVAAAPFPILSNIGYHNTFLLRFTNSLSETEADGYMTHTTADARIAGIYSTGTITYVTGSVKGSTTAPSITNTSPGDVMYTARYTHSSDTWNWGVLEGTSYSGTASGGKALTMLGSFLYVVGAASYTTGTGPGGYANNSDGVLIKFGSLASNPPSKSFVVPMGGYNNDVTSAITKDASYIYVTGKFDQGNYNLTSTSTVSPFYTTTTYTSSAYSHAFVLKFNNAGVVQWSKVGKTTSTTWPLSNKTSSTAIATNAKCAVAFGGWFKKELVWDQFGYQTNGTASPDNGHLYVNIIPTQKVTTTPVLTVTNNGSSIPVTAAGATTYGWYRATSTPLLTVNISSTPPINNPATVNQVSGGASGRYYDLTTVGTYTANNCISRARTRVQANMKKDWEEDITGVEDAVESMNTLNVFPNPFASEVQLDYSFAEQGEGLLQITDIQGRVIAERVLANQSNTESISTTEWSAGTYIAKLSQNGQTIFTKQILKQ